MAVPIPMQMPMPMPMQMPMQMQMPMSNANTNANANTCNAKWCQSCLLNRTQNIAGIVKRDNERQLTVIVVPLVLAILLIIHCKNRPSQLTIYIVSR